MFTVSIFVTANANVALAAPASLDITMSSGPRFHSTAYGGGQRWVANTGNVVYCMQNGWRFSNASRTHTRSANPIANDQVRGIMTFGFPNRSAAALGASAGVTLNNTEAQNATQLALWNLGLDGATTVSLAPGNAQGAAGARVLTAARWLVANANTANPATFADFYVYSNGRAGFQTMIYAVGDQPDPEVRLLKTLTAARGGLIEDPTRGVVDPVDGYVYYGPLTDSRFVLHRGTSDANARANAVANDISTRIGTYHLVRGTLAQAVDRCPLTIQDLEDLFTASQLDHLANAGITSWNDMVAFLALDNDTQGRDITPGWHAFAETGVPAGYHSRGDTTRVMNLTAGNMEIATFNNVPVFGHIHVQKQSSNPDVTSSNSLYSLAGARFEIRDMWGAYVGTIITDAQGRANTYNLNTSRWALPGGEAPAGIPLGRYTVTEVYAPPGFALNPTPQEVRLSAANMSTTSLQPGADNPQYFHYATGSLTFTNDPRMDPTMLMLEKVDADTGEGHAQGGATLAGAQYTFRFFDRTFPEGTSDQAIQAALAGQAPMRTWVFETQVEDWGDGVRRAQIRFDASFLAPNQPPLFTDLTGIPQLPLGTLLIHETQAPEGYFVDPNVYVSVIRDGAGTSTSTIPSTIHRMPTSPDLVFYGDVSVVKFSEPTTAGAGLQNPLPGVEFKIKDNNPTNDGVANPLYGEIVARLVTDADGFATTRDLDPDLYRDGLLPRDRDGHLPFGSYLLVENPDTVPPGFDWLQDPIPFEISQNAVQRHFTISNSDQIPVQVIKRDAGTNMPVVLSGMDFQILENNNGTPGNPIEFTWRDGNMGRWVTQDTFTTNDGGYFMLPERLQAGNYFLNEVQAPYGYLLGENPVAFTINRGSNAGWAEMFEVVKYNDPAMGQISIEKFDRLTNAPLENAYFAVYAVEDIITADNTVRVRAGEVVYVLVTDENGRAQTSPLHLGTYIVREVHSPEGFILESGVEHRVTLSYVDQYTPLVFETLRVGNTPNELRVLKVEAGTETPLEGATFDLWRTHDRFGAELDRSETATESVDATRTVTTDADGRISHLRLVPGTWNLQEVEAPEGFILDNTIHTFEVTVDGRIEDLRVLELTIENERDEVPYVPQETPDPEEPEVPEETTPTVPEAPQETTPTVKAPQTGDWSNLGLWVAIALAAAAVGTGAYIYYKRRAGLSASETSKVE